MNQPRPTASYSNSEPAPHAGPGNGDAACYIERLLARTAGWPTLPAAEPGETDGMMYTFFRGRGPARKKPTTLRRKLLAATNDKSSFDDTAGNRPQPVAGRRHHRTGPRAQLKTVCRALLSSNAAKSTARGSPPRSSPPNSVLLPHLDPLPGRIRPGGQTPPGRSSPTWRRTLLIGLWYPADPAAAPAGAALGTANPYRYRGLPAVSARGERHLPAAHPLPRQRS